MAKVIAIANNKGGVGKSTTTVHTAAAMAILGKRVLVLDMDPQGAVSKLLGLKPDEFEVSMFEVMDDTGNRVPMQSAVYTVKDNLDIVPSNRSLKEGLKKFVSRSYREEIVKRKLAPLLPAYDVILIDCPPDLNIFTENALIAAHRVLIPVKCEHLAAEGMLDILETIGEMREKGNPNLSILYILPTEFNRTAEAQTTLDELKAAYKDLVFNPPIPRRKELPELARQGISFFDRDRKSDAELISAYKFLAQEVINHA